MLHDSCNMSRVRRRAWLGAPFGKPLGTRFGTRFGSAFRASLAGAVCVVGAAGCSAPFFRVTGEEAVRGRPPAPPPAVQGEAAPPPRIALPEYVEPAAASSDSAGIARMMRVAMLWQTVSLQHPWVAGAQDAWDGALVRMLPTLRAAKSAAEMASAARALVGVLQDPATQVRHVDASTAIASPASGRVRAEMRADGADSVLLLTITPGSSYTAADSALLAGTLQHHPARVVFDLRSEQSLPAGAATQASRHAMDALLERSGIVASLIATPLPLGTLRSRTTAAPSVLPSDFLTGLDASRALDRSGEWRVTDMGTLQARASKSTPVAIIVNSGSVLPYALAALVADQRALVVSDMPTTDALVAPSVDVMLGDGVAVSVRTGALEFAGEANAARVDTVLPATASPDDGMRAALALLRRGGTVRTSRARVGAVLPAGLASYAADSVPYPSLGARVLAGFRVWSIMRTSHAHRDSYDDDIDAVFARTIARLEAAQNREQHAAALADLVSSFDDSQVSLVRDANDGRAATARAPFHARLVEGRMIVTALDGTGGGLSVGTEITSADGFPIAAWLLEHRRDVSASNEWTRMRDLAWLLPMGPAGPMPMRVREATGPERAVSVARTTANAQAARSAHERATPAFSLNNELAYLDLERLGDTMADSALAAAHSARAVILDARGTLAASPATVLRHLVTLPEFVAAQFVRRTTYGACVAESAREARRMCADARVTTPVALQGTATPAYAGRVVVLIDERTQGAAERLALALQAGANATLVGSASAGGAAPVVTTRLPGNLSLEFPVDEVRRSDGGQLHRVGLTPTVEVRPTVRGIRAGNDEVIERATAWLQGLLDGARRRR